MTGRIRSWVTYPHVVSTLALVVALGTGGAYAANTVFSGDIVDGEVKTPDLGATAVTEAKLGGGAVTSGKLKNDAVTSGKVLNETLVGGDVKDNALKGADIDESTLSNIGGGGAAGGDLTGTYPNPLIAPDAVGGDELAGVRIFEFEEATVSDAVGSGPTERVLFEPFGSSRVTAACEETTGGVVRATITFASTAGGTTTDVDSTADNGADSVTNVATGTEVPLVQVGPTTTRAISAGDYVAIAELTAGGSGPIATVGHVAALTHSVADCTFVASGQIE